MSEASSFQLPASRRKAGSRELSAGSQIVVPGSIGNVGPGFDTLGLAVALYLRVRVTRIVSDGRGTISFRFVDEEPLGENRILLAFERVQPRRRSPPSIEVAVRSEIPQRAGLGSSAAATIAGLRLREFVDNRRLAVDDLLSVATELEGHPDNIAAVVFGGLTTSCVARSGKIAVGRWIWPVSWRIVVATPHRQLSTAASRRVLPQRLPFDHVRFNLQRVAMLLGAVQERRPAEFGEALADRAHQPYRAKLVPGLRAALELRHPDVMGACLSGSGPSVAFFAKRNITRAVRAVEKLYERERVPCTVRSLRVHQ